MEEDGGRIGFRGIFKGFGARLVFVLGSVGVSLGGIRSCRLLGLGVIFLWT